MKNDKGITLVSLVVTMLVLMVLSTVTITVSLDTYDTMKVQNFIAQMKVIQSKVDNFAEENVDVEAFGFTKLADLASSNGEDYNFFIQIIGDPEAYNIDTSNSWNATIDGNIDNYYYFTPADLDEKLGIKDQEMTVIINFKTRNVITKDFVKEEDIKYYRQYELTGGEKLQYDQTRIVLSELNVGDYVTYSPSGNYTWQAEYASSDLATDGTADVTLSSASGQSFNITSWRVFSIDERTGKVELVPSAPTTGTVRLQGAQGYNNAVYLLNEACDNLYGSESKGITARSINIEDIESRMTETALAEVHSYVNPDSNTTWGTQLESAYTSNKLYPVIYAKENLSVIDETQNSTGLGMREQTELIGRTDEKATAGKLVASTSIQPYQTYWSKYSEFMNGAFKGNGTGTSNTIYNLIMPSGINTNYWMASRCVDTNSSLCDFGVNDVMNGGINAESMYYSNGSVNNRSFALFPVVSVEFELVSGNDTDGWVVE